jgi:hypothetical protein
VAFEHSSKAIRRGSARQATRRRSFQATKSALKDPSVVALQNDLAKSGHSIAKALFYSNFLAKLFCQ